jgi:hypothetical protein
VRRLIALWALLAVLAFVVSTTTTVGAATFTYDVPTNASLDVHQIVAADAGPTSLSDPWAGSAFTSVETQDTSTTPHHAVNATEAVPGIKTPYGVAEQGTDAGSIALRGQVESGGTVYRQGVTGTQQTAEGQFWAGQNPASTPGYANSYGTPGTQVAQGEYPWIMGGTVGSGTPFVTR